MFAPVYYSKLIESPVGPLQLVASEKGLCAINFNGAKSHQQALAGSMQDGTSHMLLVRAAKQLEEYFAGKRKEFDLKLDMQGTVFQIKAWKQLQKIPYGQTISYGEQASAMGDTKKARAVGAANGRNPLPIVVPCHRVIGSNGALVGFSSGLKIKELLLELEGVSKKASARKAS
jgi:methylated-DNA-[protein]-cysteine S-methyltransferase